MTRAQLAMTLAVTTSAAALAPAATAQASNPSVVVTIENAQPSRGTFLTPVWVGLHDGSFDSYDGGQPASVPLGGNEIEAVAEDGNNGPITDTFARLQPNSPQLSGLAGPSGPLAPGDTASVTFNVDPANDRYFSFASMILPSNDFFIANGNPLAHELFDRSGRFVGRSFTVAGDETNDAGTEVNDEIASNVAFLGQSAPDTGITENGVVTTPASGFAPAGTFTYPDGVLNHPVVGLGQFNTPEDGILRVSFRYVDLARNVRFRSTLTPDQVAGAASGGDGASGRASAVSVRGGRLILNVATRGVEGGIGAATLNLGQRGSDGPVIADLSFGVRGNNVIARLNYADVSESFDGDFGAFLNALAAGNVYIDIRDRDGGETALRGQLDLLDR